GVRYDLPGFPGRLRCRHAGHAERIGSGRADRAPRSPRGSQVNRAVILAGGRGTRLRPYTVSLPKPLMPVDDTPILEIILRQLAHCGFDHVTLAVNHQAELLKAYFHDGSRWSLRVD